MTETQNSIENRINALTGKKISHNKAHWGKTHANILTTNKNGEEIHEDALTKIVETEDIMIIIKYQITSTIKIVSTIKIKDDMETILEETVEVETTKEETIIEGTIAAITLTMTKKY